MATPVNCDPQALISAATPFQVIPEGMAPEVVIYLLNQLLPVPLTPQQLIDASRCMVCIPKGMQPEAQTYLLCQIANGGGSGPCVEDTPAVKLVNNGGLISLTATDPATITTIGLGSLVTVDQTVGLAFGGCVNVTLVRLNYLQSNPKYVDFYGCTSLPSLDLGALTTVVDALDIYGCTLLASIDLHSLTTAGGFLSLSENPDLVSLGLSVGQHFC